MNPSPQQKLLEWKLHHHTHHGPRGGTGSSYFEETGRWFLKQVLSGSGWNPRNIWWKLELQPVWFSFKSLESGRDRFQHARVLAVSFTASPCTSSKAALFDVLEIFGETNLLQANGGNEADGSRFQHEVEKYHGLNSTEVEARVHVIHTFQKRLLFFKIGSLTRGCLAWSLTKKPRKRLFQSFGPYS